MEGFYKIANINTYINAPGKRLALNAQKFASNSTKKEAEVILTNEKLKSLSLKYKGVNLDELSFMATGSLFHREVIKHGGIMLHASAISYKGMGLIFSAPSGTGKSTHSALWKSCFNNDVVYINDDKPIIKKEENEFFVYGSPWSGKTDLHTNSRAKIKAIVFLERASNDKIEVLNSKEAFKKLLAGTVKPKKTELFNSSLTIAEDIVKNLPIYTLKCTPTPAAVKEVLKEISKF